MSKPAVWIIDDEQGICTSLSLILKRKYEVRTFLSSAPALECMRIERCDLVLLDLKLGAENGIDVLKVIKEKYPDVVVVMMTAFASVNTSVEAMRAGAYTYLTKPLDMNELDVVVAKGLEIRRLNEKVTELSDELVAIRHYDQIVGESPAMQKVYTLIDKLKNIDSSVLITGESGTGKELVAKAIHYGGVRKEGRFIVVNCAAIPENLLEIEFFGYRKGAFTGAVSDRKGKFELADGGTLFLDEVGDMPINLQGKLLRVLQDKEFTPIGASESRKVDVRVIAATNQDLNQLIAEKKFRSDLYYRINVMSVKLPPLRERSEDIPLLCEHLLKRCAEDIHGSQCECSPAVHQLFRTYPFPGNVRQLANILEYASVLCSDGVIDLADLPDEVKEGYRSANISGSELADFLSSNSLREIERKAIELTLAKNGGRRDKTAEALGISKRGLLNKITEFGLN